MAGRHWAFLAAITGIALLNSSAARAAWPTNPVTNLPVCTAAGDQTNVTSVPDGAGGVIMAWHDPRGATFDIYAQRVSAAGVIQWLADGVAICSAADGQFLPKMIPDGAGGAIVAWIDFRSGVDYDIYAQRVSAGGTVLWAPGGVAVCSAAGTQISPAIASDSAGGAILSWEDYRAGNGDIYAQRISAAGTALWAADGAPVCTAIRTQQAPAITENGSGGAIIAWWDSRSGDYDIYAQDVSASGAPLWNADGSAICAVTGNQQSPAIAPDGSGGAIATWEDYRAGLIPDIYAQRIAVDGSIKWAANGVTVCAATTGQYLPVIVVDGAGGVIVTWTDKRSGNFDVFCQRVSGEGIALWPADGVAISAQPFAQVNPSMVSDDKGGALIAWSDARTLNTPDIYAQRVSAEGVPLWSATGVPVCTAAGAQYVPTIASDGADGAIVSWYDFRSGTGYDLYSQRVMWTGQLGGDAAAVPLATASSLVLDPVGPNPLGAGELRVGFTLPTAAAATVEVLDVAGRRITRSEVGTLGAGHHWLAVGQSGRLAPGLYLVCLRQGASLCVTRVVVMR